MEPDRPDTDDRPVRWRGLLAGEAMDMERLPSLFASDGLRVVSEGEDYYLESSAFDPSHDDSVVHAEAERRVVLLNGLAMLRVPGYRSVRLASVISIGADGEERRYLYAYDMVTVRVEATVHDGDGQEITRTEPILDAWIESAIGDEEVAEAIAAWSARPHDWQNLSNLLDRIGNGKSRKPIIEQGLATKGELRRFDGTANDPRLAGDDARHGAPPPKGTPKREMTLGEAEALAARVLCDWIEMRAPRSG